MPEKSLRVPGRSRTAFGWVGVVVLFAAFGSIGCRSKSPGVEEVSVESGASSAPAFDLTSIDGRRYRLEDFSGEVLLVEFWATWCGPCRHQADILERLYEEVQSDDVEFLAVSLGEPEDVVRNFVRKDPFPYPVLLDPKETLGYALEVYALPTVMIVDREGDISFFRAGISDGETLRRALEAAAG